MEEYSEKEIKKMARAVIRIAKSRMKLDIPENKPYYEKQIRLAKWVLRDREKLKKEVV